MDSELVIRFYSIPFGELIYPWPVQWEVHNGLVTGRIKPDTAVPCIIRLDAYIESASIIHRPYRHIAPPWLYSHPPASSTNST